MSQVDFISADPPHFLTADVVDGRKRQTSLSSAHTADSTCAMTSFLSLLQGELIVTLSLIIKAVTGKTEAFP